MFLQAPTVPSEPKPKNKSSVVDGSATSIGAPIFNEVPSISSLILHEPFLE